MGQTVAALKFQILADAAQFVDGIALTKKEIREAAKVAEAAKPAFQKFADERARLSRFVADKRITADEAATHLHKMQQAQHEEMLRGIPILSRYATALTPLGVLGAAATAATAAATGVALTVRERLTSLDALGDQAARLGADVQGLSRLKIAARLGDVDEETTIGAMRKLQVELGKAAGGNKEAAETFNKLGVSVEQAVRLEAVAQFEMVAAAIAKVPTHAEKLAIISKVMGRASTDVVTFIDDLARLNKMADESGAVVMKGLADKAGEFDLATKKLDLAWQGLGNTLTEVVAGPLTDAVDKTTELLKQPAGTETGAKMGAAWGPIGMLLGATVGQARATYKEYFGAEQVEAKKSADEEKALADARRDAAIAAGQQETATVALSKADIQAEAAAQKYLDGLRERLQLLGASTEAVTRFNAAKAGLSFMETAEAVRLAREVEERQKAMEAERDLAREIERGEDALRREAETAATSVEDPVAASERRAGRFAELRDAGLLDDAQMKALLMQEARGILGEGGAFGVPSATKGSTAARTAVLEAEHAAKQQRALDEMVKRLAEIRDKKPVEFVLVAGP